MTQAAGAKFIGKIASDARLHTAGTLAHAQKKRVRKCPYPRVKPGSVLVKIGIAAVCVDDRMYTDHVHEWFDHPLYGCGHEGVGTVVEAPQSRVFKAGDRVLISHGAYCGRCFACLNGLSQAHCANLSEIDRPRIIRMLRNAEVQRTWDQVVTHEFPMSQAEEAFRISASQQCGKILMYPHRH
jgi:threonine dehydrogenase-like Zn-dependent dehydrogenase